MTGANIVTHLDKRLGEIDLSAPTFIDILPTYRKCLEELRTLEAQGEASLEQPQ